MPHRVNCRVVRRAWGVINASQGIVNCCQTLINGSWKRMISPRTNCRVLRFAMAPRTHQPTPGFLIQKRERVLKHMASGDSDGLSGGGKGGCEICVLTLHGKTYSDTFSSLITKVVDAKTVLSHRMVTFSKIGDGNVWTDLLFKTCTLRHSPRS